MSPSWPTIPLTTLYDDAPGTASPRTAVPSIPSSSLKYRSSAKLCELNLGTTASAEPKGMLPAASWNPPGTGERA
jgi:hypothetical protein